MQDEYPQYVKLQAPCGSYNLVITVNLSTNTNSKMHPASSASKFQMRTKKYAFILVFLSVQLKSFYWPAGKKKSNNKEKHPDLPYNYYTTEGGGGTPPITRPLSQKQGKKRT